MPQLTVEAAWLPKLRRLSEVTELRDEAGHLLGYYHPAAVQTTDALKSPFSREELERRRKEPGGTPLEQILQRLGAQ